MKVKRHETANVNIAKERQKIRNMGVRKFSQNDKARHKQK